MYNKLLNAIRKKITKSKRNNDNIELVEDEKTNMLYMTIKEE